MRSALILWLTGHGLPAWLAPDYAMTVGLAGLLGAAWFLRRAHLDGADVDVERRALALSYVAALVGGYVFEALRATPQALEARSFGPILGSGRAAYGGLLAGALAPLLYLRRRRAPIAPFLDRSTIVLGVSFALVRVGCFLAGCDYGRPTGSPLGVRFPAGSEAALDHAARGFVPAGAPSLPVHPTELYEAALGVASLGVALRMLRRGRRDGRIFGVWIAMYAAGRFGIEFVRGDASRGVYAGLSTAQIVSIALFSAAGAYLLRRGFPGKGRAVTAGVTGAIVFGGFGVVRAGSAHAQEPPPNVVPPPAPPPSGWPPAAAPPGAVPAPGNPPASPPRRPDDQADGNTRRIGLRAAFGAAFTLGNARVPTGGVAEASGVYRFPFARRHRFQLGLEVRGHLNDAASHFTLGVPLELVLGVASHLEFNLGLVPGHTWIFFRSPFFAPTNAWGSRAEFGLQFPLGSRAAIGASPLAFNVLAAKSVGVITTYEPRVWVVVGLL